MIPSRSINNNSSNNNNNNNTNNHRRQWSEGITTIDKTNRLYKDDERRLLQHLINEYLLEGSNDVLNLIRNCPNEYFEALVDFIWNTTSHTTDSNEDDLTIYNQRSNLLSAAPTNIYRQIARHRLAIIFIETFKLLSTSTTNAGRFDPQRQTRLLIFPGHVRQLTNFEPDIYGLSCLALSSIILINPSIIHNQISNVIDALKYATDQFIKAKLTFDRSPIFAVSIYTLFYLLYILYPNHLRRELQLDSAQPTSTNEKTMNRAGIEGVILPLCYHFKLHPSIVCGTIENEKSENRWQNESWQQLIANGDRYVVSDDPFSSVSNDFKKRKEEDSKKIIDSDPFEIGQVISMCNEYTENVLHPSDMKSQIVKDTMEKSCTKKRSVDAFSSCSDSYCQTYEQQWQTTIQNGQMNLSRAQTPGGINRRQTNNHTNGTPTKKDSKSCQADHNIYAKVQFQLDMLDCNYEQDKREYYAHLIQDLKKTMAYHELEKELKIQELQYKKLLSNRQKICPEFHTVRNRLNEFHVLNEAFYNALSATQVELTTYKDNQWKQQNLLIEKQSKLPNEHVELEQIRNSIENKMKDIQRCLFQSEQDAKQSIELKENIKKLHIELACERKKHQLLHHSLMNIKLKSTNVENLLIQDENYDENKLTLDDKKKKFQEYRQLIDKQNTDLTKVRNQFHQVRNTNLHKMHNIRRQIDSIHICQTLLTKKCTPNSQMITKEQ